MGNTDFYLDYYNEINADDSLYIEADRRIRALAENNDDIIGAMVKLTSQAYGRSTAYANEVTIRIFIRGDDIVATEQAEQAQAALNGALNAIERQVRQRRDRLRDQQRRVIPDLEIAEPGDAYTSDEVFEGDTDVRP